ncbi:hypothetical protein ACTP2L_09785, partial [Campylobacter jejuni]
HPIQPTASSSRASAGHRAVSHSEKLMRFTSVSVAAALALVCASTSLSGQRPDNQIDPRSTALLQQGRAAQAAG